MQKAKVKSRQEVVVVVVLAVVLALTSFYFSTANCCPAKWQTETEETAEFYELLVALNNVSLSGLNHF